MEAIGPHLRQLLWRAEQPGLIPMGLARRILAQVHALRTRLELLTWLTRRYTVSGRADAERVPIIHAAPMGRAGGEPPMRLVVQALTVTLPSPMPAPSTPRASQERLTPVTPRAGSTAVLDGAPSPVLPATERLPSRLPPGSLIHPPGVTAAGAPSATSGRPSAPVPVVQPSRGPSPSRLIPIRPLEPRSSLRLVQPLPPAGGATPEGAPAGASHPSPGGKPLPRVGVTPPEGVSAVAPSLRLPRVVPRQPSEGSQRKGEEAPLVHPPRNSPPAASPPPAREVHVPAAPREPVVVHQVPQAPPASPAPAPRQDAAPVPPPLDLDALASKVRQRLLRHFAEEKVRRGDLR